MDSKTIIISIHAMALTTYLLRALPLVFAKKPIKNKFVISFLYYLPYTVLTAMTIPAAIHSTDLVIPAIAGIIVALILAWLKQNLIVVALLSCVAVYIVDLIIGLPKT